MAKIDYAVDIDLNDNQLLNVAVQSVNVLPATGTAGKLIYYTVDNSLRYWDGSAWQTVTTGGSVPSPSSSTPSMDGAGSAGSSASYARGDHQHPSDTSREATANKNAANGYAGLNASSKLAVSQIPTGATSNKIPLLKGTITNGKVLKYDSTAGGFVEASISAVLTYKGSCTYATLPTTGQQVGDVWNVTDAHGTTPAGTNYAWDGTAWDPLGGDIDLSNYATKSELNGKAGLFRGTITGDGSAKSFTVSHGLGVTPAVAIYDPNGAQIITTIMATTSAVTISFNTAPASSAVYSIICTG